MKTTIDRVEEITHETTEAFDLFRPFTIRMLYVFRSDNVRALFNEFVLKNTDYCAGIREVRLVRLLAEYPSSGLKKWVFPTLEEDMRAQPSALHLPRPA